MPDISKKTFWWLIIGLIVIRIVFLALFLNNIPDTGIRPNWRPNFVGTYQPDEIVFFDLAKSLADFSPKPSIVYIGHAVFLAPFIYFTKAVNIDMAIKPLIMVQGILVWSLALVFFVLIGKHFFRSRKLAILGGAIFLIYPYLLFLVYKLFNPKTAIAAFHYQMWIFMLSDYLSAAAILFTMWLAVKFLEKLKSQKEEEIMWPVILGAAAGITALMRPPNLIIPAFLFWYLIYLKKIKSALVLGIATFVAYLPQLIYNNHFFGRPWLFGNPVMNNAGVAKATESFVQKNWAFSNFWHNFSYFSPDHYLIFFTVAFGVLLLILFWGWQYLRESDSKAIPLFVFWFLFYWLFYGAFGGSISQLRYFLPFVPVFIYFSVGAAVYLYKRIVKCQLLTS